MRELTGGQSKVEVSGNTVREVVDALEVRFPGLRDRLVVDDRLRSGLAVSVDGAISRRRLRTKVQPESDLYFIESLGGGGLTPTLELKMS
jgi:molybdopterin synthase sulfur carrier subunit